MGGGEGGVYMAEKEGNGQIVEACECYRKINFLISHGSHWLVFKHWCDIFRLGLKNGQGGKADLSIQLKSLLWF